MESEIVTGIEETKGSCLGFTAPLGNWAAFHHLPATPCRHLLASQPIQLPACCVTQWGESAVHVTDPIHPGFAKTMPERGLLQVGVGK